MTDGTVRINVITNADSVSRQFKKLDNAVDDTTKELRQLDNQADDTSDGLNKLKGVAGAVIGVLAVREIAQFSLGLVNLASDAEETANKFSVVFSTISEEATQASEDLAQAYGLARSESQKLISDTGDLLTGFGFTQEKALELSVATQQLAVDLASFTNVEGGATRASEALTSALLGEREAVKALGIAILDENVKAKIKALEATGELTDETDREKQAIATLVLAYEQSKNAIGDFERSQDSLANQTRIALSILTDFKTFIGNELLPIATSAVTTFNDLAGAIKDLFTETDNEKIRRLSFELNEANLELKEFTEEFNGSFLRSFDNLEAKGTPRFKELTEEVERAKQALEEALNPQTIQQATTETERLAESTKKVADNLGVASNSVTDLADKAKLANDAVDESANDTADKIDEKFKRIGDSAVDNLSDALTTPFREGETAVQRFGAIAQDILQQVAQALLKQAIITGVTSAFGGGTGNASAGATATVASANGNVFSGGAVQAFANGGAFTNSIVSEPTTFPMAGGKTGLMGEAGPEAIMPLKRDAQGRLGVTAQSQQSVVNVYNNTDSQIEVVQRPDNEQDIFINRVRNAVSDERLTSVIGSQVQRNQRAGIQGA